MASDNGFASFPSSLGFNQVDIQSSLLWLGNDTLEASTPSLGCMMLTPQQPAAGGTCYLLPCNSLASKLTVQPHMKFFHSRSSMKSEQYCVFRRKKTLICGWWAHPSNQTGGASFLTNINFIGSSNTSKPTNLVPLQVLQHQLKVACRARCKLPCSKAMTPRWHQLLLNRPFHHRNGFPGAT